MAQHRSGQIHVFGTFPPIFRVFKNRTDKIKKSFFSGICQIHYSSNGESTSVATLVFYLDLSISLTQVMTIDLTQLKIGYLSINFYSSKTLEMTIDLAVYSITLLLVSLSIVTS